ncbi:hypothetical protein UFOVP447_180 [uncultured Caudovirales phage]|uniref:Uncharacterized protein n=1 Tax=uncultured Caudovirales phage TaxID=2100421 RepID=A0A6J5MDX0_9CAUD|nr:hypothetical protein UFOVP447_180 [uncultured Caudovirales phage]
MIKFEEFVQEAKEDEQDLSTKKALVNFIASNLFRFANRPEGDTKGLMLLVAALGILNTSDDASAVNVARRLATAALIARKGN